MTTKTCMQSVMTAHGRRERRSPHEPRIGPNADGYDTCLHCGVTIYVGQGELSPEASQRREHLAALADRRR